MPGFESVAPNIWHIHEMPQPRAIKHKTLLSYVRLSIEAPFPRSRKVARIAGFKVHYCTYPQLRALFSEIFIDNVYFFRSETQRPVILDCGSNIGMATLYFKMIYPACEIIAFEPDEDAFSCLEENVRDNQLANVTLREEAVSSHDGTVPFYYDQAIPGSTMNTLIERTSSGRTRAVRSTRLSKYIDRNIDFLKLDVEGAEADVIKDMVSAGKMTLVHQMLIEYHHHVIRQQDALSGMLSMLEDANFGYQIEGAHPRPLASYKFQDILIYAYNKATVRG